MRSTTNQHLMYRGSVVDWINGEIPYVGGAEDEATLRDMLGHIRISLARPASLGISFSDDDLLEFILHAQRRGLLNAEWGETVFPAATRNYVPNNPPVPPTDLALACPEAGIVNASHSTPSLGSWDRCELWHNDAGVWKPVKQGTVDGELVSYQVTGVATGDQEYCVVVKYGSFAGFPSDSETVAVT